MKTFTYGAALALFASTPVLAGDLVTPVMEQPVMMAEQPPVQAWTGGYIGGNISYGFGSLDANDDLASALTTNGLSDNLSEPDGVSGALRAGYDWQFGRGLFGLGAEYSQAEGEVSLGGDRESEDLDGVTIGFGGEYMFTQNWTGYAEYSYTDFGDVDNTDGQLEADLQQIKFGVNYRF